MVCCFLGHKEVPERVRDELYKTISSLVEEGVLSFLVGNQGGFDNMVLSVLRNLKTIYPEIDYQIVLAYMPQNKDLSYSYYSWETCYPEGLELVPPRFAISHRNRWMIQKSDIVICFVTHTWGGAAQFVELAYKKRKRVINLA